MNKPPSYTLIYLKPTACCIYDFNKRRDIDFENTMDYLRIKNVHSPAEKWTSLTLQHQRRIYASLLIVYNM